MIKTRLICDETTNAPQSESDILTDLQKRSFYRQGRIIMTLRLRQFQRTDSFLVTAGKFFFFSSYRWRVNCVSAAP